MIENANATIETPSVTYTIAKTNVDQAVARVQKANQRAAKIGQPGYTCSFVDTDPMPVYPEAFDPSTGGFLKQITPQPLYYIEQVDFTIKGFAPRIGDYQIIAVLQEDEHAGVVSRLFPGVEADLTSVRVDSMECDHCHTSRMRTKTYVLQSPDGTMIKVGRRCLSLYTGITVNGSFDTNPMRLDDEMREFIGYFGTHDMSVQLTELLALATGVIKDHGWMSVSVARDEGKSATVDHVRECFGKMSQNRENHEKFMAVADMAKVEAVIKYLREDLVFDGSEYVNNLIGCTSAPSGLVSWSNFGIVVSAIASYDRFTERQRRQALHIESTWVGTPGERMRFEVTILDVRTLAGNWSNPDLVKMVTSDGSVLTWFASKGCDWNAGDQLTITARIKDHTTYQNSKETRVTHVKQM